MKKIILQSLIASVVTILIIIGGVQAKQLWEYGLTHSERSEMALRAGIIANLSDYKPFDNFDQNMAILNYIQGQEELNNQELGSSVKPIAGSTYNLAGSGLSSSDTSLTLQNLTIPQNGYKIQDSDLSDTFYITLEPGSKSRQEIVSCTTVVQNSGGTATLSSCIRGLSPVTPYTASSTLQFSHAGGSQVIFSDPPQLFEQFAAKDNDQEITGLWVFDRYPVATSTLSTATTTYQFVTKQYADNIANQGAATSTADVAGIVREATKLQVSEGTDLGIDDPIFIPAKFGTSTPYVATSTVVITESDGKLNQLFIDLTEDYTWTGLHTYSATTTFSATTTLATTTINGNVNLTKDFQIADGQTATLSSNTIIGATSTAPLINGQATTLHTHDYSLFNGIKSATPAKTYYNFSIPLITGIWTPTTLTPSYRGSFVDNNASGGALITVDAIFLEDDGTTLNWGDDKTVIVEFGVKVSSFGSEQMAWGLGRASAPSDWTNYGINQPLVRFSVDALGNLYANTANSTGHTTAAITGIVGGINNLNTYLIEWNPAVNAKFYVNGILKQTLTTTLPNDNSGIAFGIGSYGGNNYVDILTIPYFAIEK